MQKIKFKKRDVILIAVLVVVAAALLGGQYLLRLKDRGEIENVHITVNNRDYGSYSLSHDQVIEINNTNICEIKDGKIQMTEASCPDQLCIYQGAIDDNGGTIICLPNAVIITSDHSTEE
jgi:hypothetical protein